MPLPGSDYLSRAGEVAAAAGGRGIDSFVAALAGTPARLRVAAKPGLLLGRVERLHLTLREVWVGGLRLTELDLRLSGVRVPVSWPPRLQVEGVVARARVEQRALDAWTRSSALPVRLALRRGGIIARTGVAGLRLGEIDMSLHLDGGRLWLAPQRLSMLGVAVEPRAVMPPVKLPLPRLPNDARLVAVDPDDGAVELCFNVADIDERITEKRLRWAVGALRERPASKVPPHETGVTVLRDAMRRMPL